MRNDERPTVLHCKVPFSFLPATEVFVAQQIQGLRRYRAVAAAWRVENRDLYPGLRVYGLEELPAPRRWLERAYFRVARRHGFLRRAIRAEGVRLVHAHFGPCAWFALRMVAGLEVPVIAHFYGRDATVFPREPIWRERYREVFRRAARILVLSEYLAARLKALGCPPGLIQVHPLGVDLERFRPPASPPPAEPLRLLFVGRMVPKKNPLGLLEALRLAGDRLPAWRLTMLGDGELAPAVARAVLDLGWTDKVSLQGLARHAAVLDAMRAHHILVLPSRTAADGDEEGQALVLQEAQACGLPVVSTRHNGIPEGVCHGETGVLVPPADPAALAEALVGLGREPARRQAMARAARPWVERRFDVTRLASTLEETYDAVLAQTKYRIS